MLDASTRIDVLNLLGDLKARGLGILFITHDLSLGNYISDKTMILRHGAVVEMGATEKVFGNPQHPYTKMLLFRLRGVFSMFYPFLGSGNCRLVVPGRGATDADARGESIWDRFCATPRQGACGRGWSHRLRLLSPVCRRYRVDAGARRRCVPVLGRLAAHRPGGAGDGEHRRPRLLRPPRRPVARRRSGAGRHPLSLGPAAGARGRGRLDESGDDRRLRHLRSGPCRPADSETVSRAGSPTTSRGLPPGSATGGGCMLPVGRASARRSPPLTICSSRTGSPSTPSAARARPRPSASA